MSLKQVLPFTTNHESGELNETSSPPPTGGEGERPETDQELGEAVDKLIEESIAHLREAANKYPIEPGVTLEQLEERIRRTFDTYRHTAFRLKFYPNDQACDIPPWVDPIVPKEGRPAKKRAHRRQYATKAIEFMRAHLERLVACGLVTRIGPLDSTVEAFAIAHAVVAPKKGKDEFRLAFDLRELNENVEYYGFPAPTAAELEDIFQGKRLFLSFDVAKAFWQLPLHPQSQPLYILATSDELLMSSRVIQGGENSTAAMSCAIKEVFGDLIRGNRLAVYVGDGTGGSTEYGKLLDLVEDILKRWAKHRLYLNPKKVRIFQMELSFLGKIVRDGAITPDPAMVQGIVDLGAPKHVAGILSFCGMAQWLSTHVPDLSKQLAPLHQLESYLLQGSRSRSKKAAA
jgi:hypothetical protein